MARGRRREGDGDGAAARAGSAVGTMSGISVTGVPTVARRGPHGVVVSAMSVFSAFGSGVEPLLRAGLDGTPGFRPVDRFDVGARRAKSAAVASGSPDLTRELIRVIGEACDDAGPTRTGTPLFLAIHGDPALPRNPE